MKLSFDSLDELRSFIAEIDGDNEPDAADVATGGGKPPRRRRTKAEIAADNATQAAVTATQAGFSPPLAATAPPTFTQPPSTGFPPAPGGQTNGFAPPVPPVNPLVAQIIAATDQGITSGQPLAAVEGWFRQALGPETAQANWEQIKAAFLPKAPENLLRHIANQLGIK